MTTPPAAIQGDYCDLRFIKSRKVCQVVIELPIEAGGEFVRIFGTPNPATGVPIALARIEPLDVRMQRNPNPYLKKAGGKLAQRAGILCNEGAFQKWIGANNADEAADNMRVCCGVASRADLDHAPEAARKFLDLESSYKAWLTVPT